jgi:hypothetical protein
MDHRETVEPDQRVEFKPAVSKAHGDVRAQLFVRERTAAAIAGEDVDRPLARRGEVELVAGCPSTAMNASKQVWRQSCVAMRGTLGEGLESGEYLRRGESSFGAQRLPIGARALQWHAPPQDSWTDGS